MLMTDAYEFSALQRTSAFSRGIDPSAIGYL